MIDIVKILEILPHRYPFILVDRVIDCDALTGSPPWIHAIKNVTINEPFFPGHFPSQPVMPGVLILEGLAQTAGLLLCEISSLEEREVNIFYYAGIDKARFRSPVIPGDQIRYQVEHLKTKSRVSFFDTTAFVEEKKVAEAKIMLSK